MNWALLLRLTAHPFPDVLPLVGNFGFVENSGILDKTFLYISTRIAP